MAKKIRKRVLLAPRNISGQATEYLEAVAAHGWDGEVWSIGEPAYGFAADRVIDKARLARDADYRWDVLDEAVRSFDVFHFQFSRSLVVSDDVTVPELWDLPLLKSLGKKVLMHFRGSDVRLPSVHMAREQDSYFRAGEFAVDEDRIKARVSICRRYCDRLLVSTPGLLDYVPDATWIPHVIATADWPASTRPEPDVPLVVHIPSRRAIKGSDAVDAALEPLVADGLCRYETYENLTRSGLRDVLARADLLVDSLTIGDHGLIAVEAMASGVVVLAHIHERNRQRNPGVPVVEATPASLRARVEKLARDPQARRRLRQKGRAWVERRHDRRIVGRQLALVYGEPVRRPALGHREWPALATSRRVEALEGELEAHRAARDPLEQLDLTTSGLPKFVVSRLLTRIRELERALGALHPESPLLRRGPLPRDVLPAPGVPAPAASGDVPEPATPTLRGVRSANGSRPDGRPAVGRAARLVKAALPAESAAYVRARSVYWTWRFAARRVLGPGGTSGRPPAP